MKRLFLIITLTLAACSQDMTVSTAPETKIKPTPGAYMIVSGKNYDAEDLGPYAAALPPIYEKYGGYYVAFAPKYDVPEGNSDAQAIIMSAWPSVEAAKTFWTSTEYSEAKKLREGIGKFDVVIIPALPQK